MAEHYLARPEIVNSNDFHDDLLNGDMTRSSICEKYNVSAGFVSKYRTLAKEGKYPGREASTDTDGLLRSSETTTNPDGTKKMEFVTTRPVDLEDARELIRSTGDNPDLYNISIRAINYDGKVSNKIAVWTKTGAELLTDALPLAELYKAVGRTTVTSAPRAASGRSTVIVLADWQIGKTGRRGGTPELLQRLRDARANVARELALRDPEKILILDGGDGIEGFESGGDPQFTNDLSLPDQLDCYATEMWEFVALAHEFAEVEVGAVPSNHASWRRAKQNLGTPADDFGLFVHRQVAKVAKASGVTVTWHVPDEYDESLCVDFQGTPIGLVHGNQFAPGKAIDYWQGQTFGNQALTRADVLVTGHYHSFGAGVAGLNPHTGRERMWLGAPTLDAGSDWYRNIKGRDSLPGTMIFDVTEDGFDLGSLKVL